ncbi:MAG: sulfatase [Pseudomonadota bacterium]
MKQVLRQHVAQLAAAALLLFLILIQPNHPDAVGWGSLFVFPLELPVLLLALIALPHQRKATIFIRGLLTAFLTLIAALKAADFVSFNALSRGFNPVADIALVDAFVRLLSGTFGAAGAIGISVGVILLFAALAAGLWWATGIWSRVEVLPRQGVIAAGLSGVFAVLMVVQISQAMGRWQPPLDPPGTAFTARVAVERWEMVGNTLEQLRRFRALAAADAFLEAPAQLDAIDRDVIILFVESYGRASHETEQYAARHRTTLQRYEQRLLETGLALRSGYLEAPTRGGQSWLSHATFANGLWIDNQMSYGAALASGRRSLFHHAARAGFHTAAVMPQITLDWPEAATMGFETILTFDELGYEGPAFNWVTMPDQFTLLAMDRLLRDGAASGLKFIQAALVSSHAPWVPVPDFLPWSALGNGQVYRSFLEGAETPRDVWRDRDRVREQYSEALDYALTSVLEYALLHANEPPLMIVVGDHQAAEFVALDNRPHVPLHVIGPRHLVDQLQKLAPEFGLLLPDDATVTPMSEVRDIFLSVFSNNPPALAGNLHQ